MMKNYYEIFEEFKSADGPQARVAVLRSNDTPPLRLLLRAGFHPHIQFYTNEIPPYNPSDAPPGLGETSIQFEIHRAYIFQLNNKRVSPNLTKHRKDVLLIQILESLEAREAEVFANMIQKDFKVPNLDYAIVKEAFPNLLP